VWNSRSTARWRATTGTKAFEFHALFEHSIRLNRTMGGMWIFQLMNLLAPRRTARMIEKWRAGVVLLERTPLAEYATNK
jgi:hypothetical protein